MTTTTETAANTTTPAYADGVVFERINGQPATRTMRAGSTQHQRFHNDYRWRQITGDREAAAEWFGGTALEEERIADEPAESEPVSDLQAVADLCTGLEANNTVTELDDLIADEHWPAELVTITPKPAKCAALVHHVLTNHHTQE